jgi:hypothetical protein
MGRRHGLLYNGRRIASARIADEAAVESSIDVPTHVIIVCLLVDETKTKSAPTAANMFRAQECHSHKRPVKASAFQHNIQYSPARIFKYAPLTGAESCHGHIAAADLIGLFIYEMRRFFNLTDGFWSSLF